MGTRLSKAPVCFTLAQMRFNPVLVMEPLLRDLQDAFRKAGFPDYTIEEVRAIEVSPGADGLDLRGKAITRYVYRNQARTAAVLLDPSALTYELSDYPDFTEFSRTFLEALRIVNEHRTIEYSDRLGIRMLDAIQPGDGETFDQYLVPQALGFAHLIGEALDHEQSLTESLFQRSARTLVVRAVRIARGVATPPDLAPIRLKLRERFVTHKGGTVMLDCDSSNTSRMDYNPEAVEAELSELKTELSRSFKALVTPYALKAWT